LDSSYDKEVIMRVNIDAKTVDMEARDINYILPAYIQLYLFTSKNQDPDKIVFPMFLSVPHPSKPGVHVPIEWVPMTDPRVAEIAEDGSIVPEVTPEQEAALDAKDENVKELKQQVADSVSPAKASMQKIKIPAKVPDRVPKMPASGDIGPGAHPDSMGSRDVRLDKQISRDLKDEPNVVEADELPAEIEKPK